MRDIKKSKDTDEYGFYDKMAKIQQISHILSKVFFVMQLILGYLAFTDVAKSLCLLFINFRYDWNNRVVEFTEKLLLPVNSILPMSSLSQREIDIITYGGTGMVIILWMFILNYFHKIVKDWASGNSPFDNCYVKGIRVLSVVVALVTGIFQPVFFVAGFVLFVFSYILEYGNALEHTAKESRRSHEQMILSFAEITEAKSGQTGQHVKRVSEYSRILAEGMGLPKSKVEEIRVASMMHDVGKIMIPLSILEKQGKLTDEEFEIIKKHTEFGKQILQNTEGSLLQCAKNIAGQHHEKWNGTGYAHIQGKDIAIEARIVAVADVYDALVSKRSYKEPISPQKVYDMIVEESGKHFDPEVVSSFEKQIKQIKQVREQFLDKD